ncbi:MAG: phosphopantetheine-binding protein [Pirellulaceae bacterium]|tara:strand:+ start:2145 stop:2399 length:255 start_codon:yes stop_codon:yes gene_type:complete
MATVQERVISVTAQVLQLDPTEIKLDDEFGADLGAESVQSIELVAMFEEEFGIEMEEDAALAVSQVGNAIDFITKTCAEQGVEV